MPTPQVFRILRTTEPEVKPDRPVGIGVRFAQQAADGSNLQPRLLQALAHGTLVRSFCRLALSSRKLGIPGQRPPLSPNSHQNPIVVQHNGHTDLPDRE